MAINDILREELEAQQAGTAQGGQRARTQMGAQQQPAAASRGGSLPNQVVGLGDAVEKQDIMLWLLGANLVMLVLIHREL